MPVICKARLVCVMSVHVPSVYVINVLSRQIHIVFTSTLKMSFLQESTRTDCTIGRRYEFIRTWLMNCYWMIYVDSYSCSCCNVVWVGSSYLPISCVWFVVKWRQNIITILAKRKLMFFFKFHESVPFVYLLISWVAN